MKHVLKGHGDEKKEKQYGQIAINENDFKRIPEIVSSPDLVMFGAKRHKNDVLYYVKKMSDGTTLYLEEVLSKNKKLRSKTMFKRKNDVNEEKFKNIVTMNNKTDILKIKIVKPESTGSNPSCERQKP
jgi:hypothetical protein